jgi:hypothetical protein
MKPAPSEQEPGCLRRLLPDRDVALLSLARGSWFQSAQRSRKVILAICAIRSSSDGHA